MYNKAFAGKGYKAKASCQKRRYYYITRNLVI